MTLEFITIVIVFLDMTCIQGGNKLKTKTKYRALYKVITLSNILQRFSLMNVYIHVK